MKLEKVISEIFHGENKRNPFPIENRRYPFQISWKSEAKSGLGKVNNSSSLITFNELLSNTSLYGRAELTAAYIPLKHESRLWFGLRRRNLGFGLKLRGRWRRECGSGEQRHDFWLELVLAW
jgi:hypothetical protein